VIKFVIKDFYHVLNIKTINRDCELQADQIVNDKNFYFDINDGVDSISIFISTFISPHADDFVIHFYIEIFDNIKHEMQFEYQNLVAGFYNFKVDVKIELMDIVNQNIEVL
jgi:hypothetical protein